MQHLRQFDNSQPTGVDSSRVGCQAVIQPSNRSLAEPKRAKPSRAGPSGAEPGQAERQVILTSFDKLRNAFWSTRALSFVRIGSSSYTHTMAQNDTAAENGPFGTEVATGAIIVAFPVLAMMVGCVPPRFGASWLV